jgi:hypothetical protein
MPAARDLRAFVGGDGLRGGRSFTDQFTGISRSRLVGNETDSMGEAAITASDPLIWMRRPSNKTTAASLKYGGRTLLNGLRNPAWPLTAAAASTVAR